MDLVQRVSLFYTLFSLLLVPIELYLAFLVLKRDKHDIRNRRFFFFALSMIGFLLTNFFADALTSYVPLIWTLRFYFVSTTLLTTFIFLFVFVFPTIRPVKTFVYWGLVVYGILASCASLTPLIVQNVTVEPWGANIVGGPFFTPYNLLNLVLMIALFVTLVRLYLKSKGIERRQTFILSLGFFSFFVVNLVVNIILPIATGTAQWARYGSYASVVFLACTAYAIVAYQLFDIRVVIARTIIYTSLLAMIMAVYGLTVYLFASLFGNQANSNLAASLVTTTILAFSFDPLKNWIANKTDGWLYKKEYEQQEVTRILSEKLSNVVGLDEGLDVVMHQLTDTLHLSHAVTYVFQTGEFGKPEVKRSRDVGYANPTAITLEEHDLLVDYFSQHGAILSIPQLEQQINMEEEAIAHNRIAELSQNRSSFLREHAVKKTVLEKLKKLEASVALPLQLHLQQPLKSV